MHNYFAVDTSNYTTSAAILTEEGIEQNKKLLPVKEGQLGLRQSDAVFHHTQQLHEVSSPLLKKIKNISAIGVSVRPRDIEGSYMPCFTVGYNSTKMLADAFKVPLYEFSHQSGHIAAALYSCRRLDLLKEKFIAYHVSGGTTEAVLVSPDEEHILKAEIVSQALDLKAGQAVDRTALMLGLSFPGGIELEKLAQSWTEKIKIKPTMKNDDFCLSGLQNQCETMLKRGEPKEKIARYCLEFISGTLEQSCLRLFETYGRLPVVFAGGVMSNTIIRANLEKRLGAFFAEPEFSRDNAAGIAVLTAIANGEALI